MKNLVIILFLQAAFVSGQNSSNLIEDSKGRTVLWGTFTQQDLQQEEFKQWFAKGYENYSPDMEITDQLRQSLTGYTIKVFMGTWCGDSKREVPRLLKILNELNYPKEQLELIALRGDGDFYKQGPNKETEGLNIHRVPTIIVYKNGQEVNRIVEEPVNSLEADLLAIISGDYTPNYPLANSVGTILEQHPKKRLSEKELNDLAEKWADNANNYYELNTLAYVQSAGGREPQALDILKLNAMIFPEEAQVHYRLGQQQEALNMLKAAAVSYAKAAELKPKITDYTLALARVRDLKDQR